MDSSATNYQMFALGELRSIPFQQEFLIFWSKDRVPLRMLVLRYSEAQPRIWDVNLTVDPPQETCLNGGDAELIDRPLDQSLNRIYYPDGIEDFRLQYGGQKGFWPGLLSDIQTRMGSRLYYLKCYRRWRGKLPGPYFYYSCELFAQIASRVVAAPDVFHLLAAYPDASGEKEVPLPYWYDPQYNSWPRAMAWYHPLHIQVGPYPDTANTTIRCQLAQGIERTYEIRSTLAAQVFAARLRECLKGLDENHDVALYHQGQRLLPEEPLPNGAILTTESESLPVVWGLESIIERDMEYQSQLCCDILQRQGHACSRFRQVPLPVNAKALLCLGYDPWRRGFYVSDEAGRYQMGKANAMVTCDLEKISRALVHDSVVVDRVNHNDIQRFYYIYPPSLYR